MNKIFVGASEALAGVTKDGRTTAVGGFGLCGIPEALIAALCDSGVKNLICIPSNVGVDGFGLGLLLEVRQTKKMISSYVDENKEFERQHLAGKLELELILQGTLAEKLRAGGTDIPAFLTKTDVGTLVAEDKELREFDGETYAMERSLIPGMALVKAQVVGKFDGLCLNLTTHNSSSAAAVAGEICIVKAEEIVEAGKFASNGTHLPGAYVHRIVLNVTSERHTERYTVRVTN